MSACPFPAVVLGISFPPSLLPTIPIPRLPSVDATFDLGIPLPGGRLGLSLPFPPSPLPTLPVPRIPPLDVSFDLGIPLPAVRLGLSLPFPPALGSIPIPTLPTVNLPSCPLD